MALGAQTRDVLAHGCNQGMRPVVIGLAIGIASAFALGRLLTAQLYQISPHNPALLAASAIFWCGGNDCMSCFRRDAPHTLIRFKRYAPNDCIDDF